MAERDRPPLPPGAPGWAASLRIGVAEIDVTDLTAAWDFYVETLGIAGRSIGHFGEVGPWGDGRGKPFELYLGECLSVLVYRASVRTPNMYPHGTGVKVAIFTDDIEATVAAWRARGVDFVRIPWSTEASGIASSPYGPFIAFKDPFGNIHELLQPEPQHPPPRATWRHTDLTLAARAAPG